MIPARVMLASCALVLGCSGEPRAAAPRSARDSVAPPSASVERPPPGTPIVETPDAIFWTDPVRGSVLRAPRDPSAGEVTVVARGRSAPGHLVREPDGDLYWVEYRRADARCDFVRLASGASTPEVLFEDGLGDFSETVCETALAVDPTGRHLFWLHGSDVYAATPSPGASPVILARDQPYPIELATDGARVYWLALGGDPYEDDLTERGSLRAVPIEGGSVSVLIESLTEPHALVITDTAIELRDGDELLRRVPRPAP